MTTHSRPSLVVQRELDELKLSSRSDLAGAESARDSVSSTGNNVASDQIRSVSDGVDDQPGLICEVPVLFCGVPVLIEH